jgi:hypothetical protein
VRLSNVAVSNVTPAPDSGDMPPTYEFELDGNTMLRVNDFLYAYGEVINNMSNFPPLGEKYATLTGILELRNSRFKLEPRSNADMVLGPPQIASIAPSGFIRVNTVAPSGALPVPMLVTLTRPAIVGTTLTVTSSDPVLTPTAVITPGQISVPVSFTSGTPATTPFDVTVTARVDGVDRTATIRIFSPSDPNNVKEIRPSVVSVPFGGTAPLEVVLDLPAPSGGLSVMLSALHGMVPTSVTVAQDATSAPFTYTQVGVMPTDTITATTGGVMRTASVQVGSSLVINEVDYDNVGADTDEFIELYNPSPGPISLDGLAVVLINGSPSSLAEYARIPLSGSLPGDSYLVIASGTVQVDPGATLLRFSKAQDNIQNGDPDGIALINTTNGELIDALSYEGSITAGKINGFMQTFNLVEGTVYPNSTATNDSNSVVRSLIRHPNGMDSDNAATDWTVTNMPTPGAPNVKVP